MKKYLSIFILSIVISSCSNSVGQQAQYGAKIDAKGAIPIKKMIESMGDKTEMEGKIEGVIKEVCQVKGCWMSMEKGDGTNMRVTFKDYGFFVPKDLSGKTVIIKGKASVSTTSVEELRHYAEDGGASAEEIAKITAPKRELAFEAEGVIVK